MNEKIKGFVAKEVLSDEELEAVLFAVNSQNAAYRLVVKEMRRLVRQNMELMNIWLVPRLKSGAPLSDGLRNEMRCTMSAMKVMSEYFADLADLCLEYQESADWSYRAADQEGVMAQKNAASE